MVLVMVRRAAAMWCAAALWCAAAMRCAAAMWCAAALWRAAAVWRVAAAWRCVIVRCWPAVHFTAARSAVHFTAVHFAAMRSAVHFTAVHFAAMRPAVHFTAVRSAVAIVEAVSIMSMLGLIAAASAVSASMAMIEEAMFAPAVTIAPAGPGAHAQEDAVVEIIRPVIARRGTAIRWIFVIAPMTIDGRFADFNDNLRANLWHKGQARKQCRRAE